MKTIRQAIIDEIYYPIGGGVVDNKLIKRGVNGETEFTQEVANSSEYKGVLADCLYSLIQAISFSEADKSVSSLTDSDKRMILKWANSLYTDIGEPEVTLDGEPRVYIL